MKLIQVSIKSSKTFEGSEKERCVVVMDNGNLVTASLDGYIKIWSRETCECLHTLIGHADFFGHAKGVNSVSLAILPNDEIVSVFDSYAKIWM